MFDKAPSSNIPNYQLATTPVLVSGSIVIPVASLNNADNVMAHASTGDIRALLLAVVDTLHDKFTELVVQDRPTKLTIRRTTTERPDGLHRTYVINSTVVGDLEVAPE